MKKSLVIFITVFFLMSLGTLSYAANLRIDGSTTVLPIAQKAAEVFMKKNPSVKVYVSGSGSGTGIKALIDGTTDIATSSREAKDKEVASGMHYPIPLHLQKCFADYGYKKGEFKHTEMLSESGLSLPMYPEMEEAQVKFVCDQIINFFR